MGQAYYRIHVPATDRLGQTLHRYLPDAAHEWLQTSAPRLFENVWIEGPHTHSFGPAHHVVAVAEDTPETDSYAKQLAAYIGEVANHPAVSVQKQSNKVASWTVPNRNYVEGVGANPRHLDSQTPVTPVL